MSLANEMIAMGILKATEKPSEIQTVYAYSNPLSLSEYGAYTPIRLRSETRMTVNADLERNKPRD